jgi:hypothetical protein
MGGMKKICKSLAETLREREGVEQAGVEKDKINMDVGEFVYLISG